MKKDMPQHCLACRKPFQEKIDKKYCSDECRFTTINLKRRENPEAKLITTKNSILRKNRSTLKSLNPEVTTRLEEDTFLS